MASNGLLGQLKQKLKTAMADGAGQDENDIVTIATFQSVMRPHAQFLQARLEAAGITCILNGQWHTNADFARLQVRRADVVRANAILKDTRDP